MNLITTCKCRTLEGEVEDLSRISFVLPPDALQQPPSAAQRPRPTLDRRVPPLQLSPDQAPPPVGGPFAASAAADRAALAGTGLEDLLVPSPASDGCRIYPPAFFSADRWGGERCICSAQLSGGF